MTSCSFSPPYWISWTKVQSTWPLSICIFLQIARTPLCSLRLILGLKNSRIRWSYKRAASNCHLFFPGYRMRNKTRCWNFWSCPFAVCCVSRICHAISCHKIYQVMYSIALKLFYWSNPLSYLCCGKLFLKSCWYASQVNVSIKIQTLNKSLYQNINLKSLTTACNWKSFILFYNTVLVIHNISLGCIEDHPFLLLDSKKINGA